MWLCFAALTFVAYIVLVLTASGDLGLRWTVGFVMFGSPTMLIGAGSAIVLTRRGHNGSLPSFRTVVSLSLVAWGMATMALELGASTEYLAAALFWIAAPTLVSAAAAFAIRTPHAQVT